jgi:hypothetical protein
VADLTAICNGLAAVLGGVPGLRVSPTFVAQVNPPAAIIIPQPGQSLKFDTIDGGVSYLLRVVLLVGYAEDTSSVALINTYLASTGPSSVLAAIKASPRLAGVYDYANVESVRGYGLMEWAGQQYLGSQVLVNVMAATP